MKSFKASATIAASTEQIWEILTDGPSYPEWDPGMDRLEGTVALGEKVTAYTKISPDRAFPVKVTDFEPGKFMTWTGGMPLGLFKGVRTFKLTPLENGETELFVQEVFTGPLLPLFGRTIPDLTPAFENFVNGLKKRAEAST
jgi:hypothetical protein